MKFLTVIALLSLSVSSFAGRIVKAGGSCHSTVDSAMSARVQEAEVTACAEREARTALNRQCSGGDYYINNETIAQRSVRQNVNQYGRTITVSATAVGSCERFNQF